MKGKFYRQAINPVASIMDNFAPLNDPRQTLKVIHPLQLLDIKETIVTIDAMETQKKTRKSQKRASRPQNPI